jgi:hypothetical protein
VSGSVENDGTPGLYVIRNTGGVGSYITKNGVQFVSGTVGSVTWADIYMGSRGAESIILNGRWAEAVIISGAPTDADLAHAFSVSVARYGTPAPSPQTSAPTTSSDAGPVTTLSVSVPSVSAGQAVQIHVTSRLAGSGSALISPPDGTWRVLDNGAVASDNFGRGIFVKKYTSDEDPHTVNFTTADAVEFVAHCHVVSFWGGDIDNDVIVGVAGSPGTTDTPDPPEVSLPSGAENALAIASASWWTAPATVSSYPSGYNDGTATLGTDIATGSAWRAFSAASENPGSFTLSEVEGWSAHTVVYRPLS